MSDRLATQTAPVVNETQVFPAGVESVIGGRYRVLRKLGEGGFAYVFEASHIELPDLHYAIKVLRGEHAGEEEVIRKFRHEAVLLSGLKCPQTVRVVDFGLTSSGSPYFVMEFVKGVTLESLLAREGRLRPTDVARLTMDVLESLDEAHNARIVHRDIKPANILVVPGFAGGHPRAKVLDFGIAKVLAGQGEGAAAANQTVGDFVFCTPLYAPAEVLRRDPKPQSDLYSLGHVMAELLEGEAPFVADVPVMSAYRHLSGEPIALGPHAEASGLAAIIRKATAHAVEARYATAAEMLLELRAVMQRLVAAAGQERVLVVEADALAMGESAERFGGQEIDTSLPASTDAFPPTRLTGSNEANHTPTQALGGATAPQSAPVVPSAPAAKAVPSKPVASGPRAEVSGPATALVVGEMQARNRNLKLLAGFVVAAVVVAAGALVAVLRGMGADESPPAVQPAAAPLPEAATAPATAAAPPMAQGSGAPDEGSAAAPAPEALPGTAAAAAAPSPPTSRSKRTSPSREVVAEPAPAPAVEAPPAPPAPKVEPPPVVAPEVKPSLAEPAPAPKPRLRGRDSIFIPTAPK